MTDSSLVAYHEQDGIAHFRLNRPAKHNAINDQLLLDLDQLFDQLPEGHHGIFVGGGGSVRIARLIADFTGSGSGLRATIKERLLENRQTNTFVSF